MPGQSVAVALRGLRSRTVLTLGTVLLATIGIAAAVVGPAYLRAATNSLLLDRIEAEPVYATGLTWQFTPAPIADSGGQAILEAASSAAVEHAPSGFEPPHASLISDRFGVAIEGFSESAEVALGALDDGCRRLVVTGRCPRQPFEILVAHVDVERGGLEVGDQLTLPLGDRSVVVVGSYRLAQPNSAWYSTGRYDSAPPVPAENPYLPAPFLTVPASFDAVPPDQWVANVDRSLLIHPGLSPDTAEELANLAQAERTRKPVRYPAGVLEPAESSGLRDVLDEVEAERQTARDTILPASLSLSLVSLLLLLRLLGESADLRRSEFALLSLRGWSRRRLWMFGLAEAVLVLVVAAPLGAVLGWRSTEMLADAWLYSGLPVELTTGSLLGALGVLLAGLVAASTGLVHVMREQLREQLDSTSRPRALGRIELALQVAVVVAAGFGAYSVAGRDLRGSPGLTDLLLPLLLSLAAGLIAGHLTVLLARWLSRRSAGRVSLTVYLSARRLSRRREGTLVVLPLAVALGVGVFAAGVQLAAATWRDSVAASRVGADLAYPSELPPARVLGLTRELDPDGEWLMAAAVYADIRTPEIAALDTTRMGTVGVWPSMWGPGADSAAVADALAPERPPPRLDGRRLALAVTNALRPRTGLTVTLLLRDESGVTREVVLPELGGGSSTLEAAIDCGHGCDLVGIQVAGLAGTTASMRGVLTIREISVDGQAVDAGLGDAEAWRPVRPYRGPDGRSVATVDADDSGLRLSVDTGGHLGAAEITPTDVPDVRPIIATSGVELTPAPEIADDVGLLPGAGTEPGAPGALPVRVVGVSEAVPLLGRPGVLVDLDAYLREDYFEGTAGETPYVLAREGVPDDIVAALADAGVDVDQPLSLAAEQEKLGNDAYALSLRLYVVVAAALLLLALAGVTAHLVVGMAGRRHDAASLRVVGVSKRTVLRAGLADLAVTLGVAAVAGVVAGLVAQRIVLGQIRLGTADSRSPDIPAEIDLPMLGVYTTATALVLLVMSAAVARASVRRARGAQLRESAR